MSHDALHDEYTKASVDAFAASVDVFVAPVRETANAALEKADAVELSLADMKKTLDSIKNDIQNLKTSAETNAKNNDTAGKPVPTKTTPTPSPTPPPYSFFTAKFRKSGVQPEYPAILDFENKTYDKNLQTLIENEQGGSIKSYVTSKNNHVISIKIPTGTDLEKTFYGKMFDFIPSTYMAPSNAQASNQSNRLELLPGLVRVRGTGEQLLTVRILTPGLQRRINRHTNEIVTTLDKNGDQVIVIVNSFKNLPVGKYTIPLYVTQGSTNIVSPDAPEDQLNEPERTEYIRNRHIAIIEVEVTSTVSNIVVETPKNPFEKRTDINAEGQPLVVPTTFRPVIPVEYRNDVGLHKPGVIDFVPRKYDSQLKDLIETAYKGSVRLYITKKQENIYKIEIPRNTEFQKDFNGVYLIQPPDNRFTGFESRVQLAPFNLGSESGEIGPTDPRDTDVITPAGTSFRISGNGDLRTGNPVEGGYPGVTLEKLVDGKYKNVFIFSYNPFTFDIFQQLDYGQPMMFKLKTTKELDPGKYIIKFKADTGYPQDSRGIPPNHETGDSVGIIEVNVV